MDPGQEVGKWNPRNPGPIHQRGTGMTENRGCFLQVGKGIGFVLGTGIIVLFLLWVWTVVMDLLGVVV